MHIDLIGFDADDTLWHTNIHYVQAQLAFTDILSKWASSESINHILEETILTNLPRYGYGIKAFTLSMIQAALKLSNGNISGDKLEEIIKIGWKMLDEAVVVLPHVKETLAQLSTSFPMMILTKGDLLDQTNKINRSGLASYFFTFDVVHDKTPEAYAKILENQQVKPHNFLMIGNTLRSDIQPVLELGGTAVYIPANTTWDHEHIHNFDTSHERFHTLEHIGQLPQLIAEISRAD